MGPVNRLAYIKGRIPLKSILVFQRLLIKRQQTFKKYATVLYVTPWTEFKKLKSKNKTG